MQSATLSDDISSDRFATSARAAAVAPGRARSWRAPVLWGGLGFLLGMAFWHAVGFWSFLTATVLRVPPSGLIAVVVEPGTDGAAGRSAGIASKRGEAVGGDVRAPAGSTGGVPCAALHLDRQSMVTRLADCADGKALAQGSGVARADRLDTPAAPVAAWSAEVAPATRISSGE